MHNFRHPVSIGSHLIGVDQPPFGLPRLVAPQPKSRSSLELADAAATAGVHALKLQTYTADTITLNVSGGISKYGMKEVWAGQNLHDLYAKAHTMGVVSPDYGAGSTARSAVFQFTVR